MPRRDGTGPLGQGARTGRGLGYCEDRPYGRDFNAGVTRGFNSGFGGRGCNLGFGRGCNFRGLGQASYANDKDALAAQKSYLESKLEFINKQLGKK